jgi:small subunit ribosomal protein S16
MVKIRLRRTGAKKQPSYRVVVADSRQPRDGRFIEIIGHYNPTTQPTTVHIDESRALHWLSVGAQPTDPVKRLLQNLGTLDKFARLKEGADLAELLAGATASREKREAGVQEERGTAQEEAAPDQGESSEAS